MEDKENPKRSTLAQWTRRISEEEMPIFGHTVQQVLSVAEDDEAPSVELARVILQDASMTARVLKLVNTIFYNPRAQSISTISRAVVVLGFNAVRTMCLTISLVDSFVQGAPRDQLTRELARSLHAAVQARAIAAERGDDSPEEVFIATLLYRLGELAFWCFGGEQAEELAAAMRRPGCTAEMAQDEVLGFRLNQLTSNLVREWRVNDLLIETLHDPRTIGDRGRPITVGHDLAVAAEKGWNSPEVREVTDRIARIISKHPRETKGLLKRNAREAARIAAYYGAAMAAKTIPLPDEAAQEEEEVEAETETPEYPEPDNMLQLKILRELAMLLEGKANFNLVMELVLEGIYRGVGVDRTLFALLTPDRRSLRGKFMLGPGRDELLPRFHFIRQPQQNVLFASVDRQSSLWADTTRKPELQALVPPALTEVIGQEPFFVSPIVVNGKTIGLFFADRGLSGRTLDEESFEGFRYFVQQANMGLSVIMGRGKGS